MDETSLKTATLYAIHKHIAVSCKERNAAWLRCKAEHADPAKCLPAGRDIMNCVSNLYSNLQKKADPKLKAYCDCMDFHTYKFEMCVKERKEFEEAVPVGSV